MSLKIAVFAGDASGDYQCGRLFRLLSRRVPDLETWGVGGAHLRQAGCDLVYDASRCSAIGIVQASKLIAHGLVVLKKVKTRLEADPPDFVLAVDFGAFNLRLAPWVRQKGIPVAYWFPPGSWRREPPSEKIVSSADYFISPYPWYADLLKKAGAKADFLGHPLIDQVRPTMEYADFMKRIGLPESSQLAALLPGSRSHEVEHILPPLVGAARNLRERYPNLAFVVPLSDHYPAANAASILRKNLGGELESFPIVLARSATQEALCHARAAVICSGSATLEAIVAKCPMVVVYRGSKMMKLEYKLRRLKIRHIAMPNILADDMAVPELRQDDVTAATVASHLESLLGDTPERQTQVRRLEELRSHLEPAGALERTADALLNWYGQVSEQAARS